MTDEDTSVVEEQIDAAPQEEVVQEEVPLEEPTESKQERNWRQLEEERNYYRQMYEQRSQAPQEQSLKDDFDLNSVREDDVPTYGELKKILSRENEEKQYLYNKLNDLELRSKYSDVDDVISNYLPDALKDEPDLAQAVKSNPQLKRLAYKLAQSSPRYHQERLAKSNQGAVNKIVENSTRAHPASSRKNIAMQDEDARYQSMSDEDVLKNFNMAKARY